MTEWVKEIKQVDPIIFHPKRILIMSLLLAIGPISQGDLRQKCNLTWGSLTSHLQTLEQEGYIIQQRSLTLQGARILVEVTNEGIIKYKATLISFQDLLMKSREYIDFEKENHILSS